MATSIRDHTGPVYICGTCGQPSFEGEHGDQHFDEQWDGVLCPWFPLAGKRLIVQWDEMSLDAVRAQYPDGRTRRAVRSRRAVS